MDNKVDKHILLKLIHSPGLSFNELWAHEGRSNNFAYYLKKLQEQGFVVKENDKYFLSEAGKGHSAFVEGVSGKKADFPALIVVILAKNNGKYLCQKRLKEPFYHYVGFVAGKINFGLNIIDCAKRDLKEETGLEAEKIKIKGIVQIHTYEQEKLLFHHYMIITIAEGINGNMMDKTHKGENFWLSSEEYNSMPLKFPNILEEFLLQDDFNFKILELERYMVNGVIKSSKILSKTQH